MVNSFRDVEVGSGAAVVIALASELEQLEVFRTPFYDSILPVVRSLTPGFSKPVRMVLSRKQAA